MEDHAMPEDSASESESSENDRVPGWAAQQLADVARRGQPGAVPGHLHSDPEAAPVDVYVIQYDAENLTEQAVLDLNDLRRYAAEPAITWVNVIGLRDAHRIAAICRMFGVHSLVAEDIVHPHQRAKVDQYDDQTFIVARMPESVGGFDSEQISIILCPHAVLTFQEKTGDCLDPVRMRIRRQLGRIRRLGHDYLVYSLLDAIVDAYFPVLAKVRERLDGIEQELTESPSVDSVAMLQRLRTVLFVIRGTISPHKEAVSQLLRDQRLISDDTKIYLRDCADHVHQVLNACETTRELVADLRDYCFAEISFNQNETMKTLTVMASVFIPLSFIAGFYGMNFDPSASGWNMPETKWKFGYAFAIGLMVAVAGLTLGALKWMAVARRIARRNRFQRTQRILD